VKPLVNYCRWNRARLRLRGRDENFVRGQLVFMSDDGEEVIQDFRFALAIAELTLITAAGEKTMILDEMGIPVEN
jgi:hypothetical protein